MKLSFVEIKDMNRKHYPLMGCFQGEENIVQDGAPASGSLGMTGDGGVMSMAIDAETLADPEATPDTTAVGIPGSESQGPKQVLTNVNSVPALFRCIYIPCVSGGQTSNQWYV